MKFCSEGTFLPNGAELQKPDRQGEKGRVSSRVDPAFLGIVSIFLGGARIFVSAIKETIALNPRSAVAGHTTRDHEFTAYVHPKCNRRENRLKTPSLLNWRREWDCVCREFQNHIENAKIDRSTRIRNDLEKSAMKLNEVRRSLQQPKSASS
jgi:hypothetical protein